MALYIHTYIYYNTIVLCLRKNNCLYKIAVQQKIYNQTTSLKLYINEQDNNVTIEHHQFKNNIIVQVILGNYF